MRFKLRSLRLSSSLSALPFSHVPQFPRQTTQRRARSIHVRLELPPRASGVLCLGHRALAGAPSPPPPLPSQLRSIVCPAPSREISLVSGDPLCNCFSVPHCCVRDVRELSGFHLDTCVCAHKRTCTRVCACMSCECYVSVRHVCMRSVRGTGTCVRCARTHARGLCVCVCVCDQCGVWACVCGVHMHAWVYVCV